MNFCRDKFRLKDNMFKGLMQKVASRNHPKMNSKAKHTKMFRIILATK